MISECDIGLLFGFATIRPYPVRHSIGSCISLSIPRCTQSSDCLWMLWLFGSRVENLIVASIMVAISLNIKYFIDMMFDPNAEFPSWLHSQLRNDTLFLGSLPLCVVLLMNQSACPWLIAVPAPGHWREMIELPPDVRAMVWAEIDFLALAMQRLHRPHKLNLGALGNMVPQLHVHIIGRNTDDPAWPRPVWGNVLPQPYADSDQAVAEWRQGLIDFSA